VSLTACVGSTPPPQLLTRVEVVRPQVPVNKLFCASEPAPPAEGATQRGVAWYLRVLRSWGKDCESRVDELRALLRPTLRESEPVQ
jgi:hypothetical protein